MPTYEITWCRVENKLYTTSIEAKNEQEAEKMAYDLLDADGWSGGECVHAEEFVHDSTCIGGTT